MDLNISVKMHERSKDEAVTETRKLTLFTLKESKGYWWRLENKLVGCHENIKLERSGVGNPRAIRALCHLVCSHKPQIFFLSKTKCSRIRAQICKRNLGFDCCFSVDSIGKRWGYCCFGIQRLT